MCSIEESEVRGRTLSSVAGETAGCRSINPTKLHPVFLSDTPSPFPPPSRRELVDLKERAFNKVPARRLSISFSFRKQADEKEYEWEIHWKEVRHRLVAQSPHPVSSLVKRF